MAVKAEWLRSITDRAPRTPVISALTTATPGTTGEARWPDRLLDQLRIVPDFRIGSSTTRINGSRDWDGTALRGGVWLLFGGPKSIGSHD